MKKQLLINRNETLQGPSPKVMRALRNFSSDHANRYLEGHYGSILVPALAKKFGIAAERIIIGYGSANILHHVFDHLDPAKDAVLAPELHFAYYEEYPASKGIRFETFGVSDQGDSFAFDVEDCLAKMKMIRPAIVLLTSPNNPTGNSVAIEDLARVLAASNSKTLVILDEVCFGFRKDSAAIQKKVFALLDKNPNLLVLRSFSKTYAMAGLRIGFGLCGKDVKRMIGYRSEFLGSSRILEEAAIAALGSDAYYRAVAKEMMAERDAAIGSINKLAAFHAYRSDGNFFAVRVDSPAIPLVKKEMAAASVLVFKFVRPDLLRVSVGPHKHMASFIKMLEKIDRAVS